MELLFITPTHPLYAQELDLRYRVLRQPLGGKPSDVVFPFENESLHLVAHEGGTVQGCVLFHPDEPKGGRLFQMAVEEKLRGTAVGRKLVDRLEEELRTRGFEQVHLHARETATGFYERLGYGFEGEPYTEVGIPHRNMRKHLGNTQERP